MEYWMTVVHVGGDLIYFAAAVITLVAAVVDRRDKHVDDACDTDKR
jgi:hypothetical protein